MMDKQTLRRADIVTGFLIGVLGVFIIGGAMQMPMKDSWGGVQNVWYVSPALFPLFVGAVLSLLGIVLTVHGLRCSGLQGVQETLGFLGGKRLAIYLRRRETIRFYCIVANLLVFVFLMVPRIDFFIAATLFLFIFFLMFYVVDDSSLGPLLVILMGWTVILGVYLLLDLNAILVGYTAYPLDFLALLCMALFLVAGLGAVTKDPTRRRRFYLSLSLALIAPLTIGVIFKYFLLVPMPCEGVVVWLLDAFWYADFWS